MRLFRIKKTKPEKPDTRSLCVENSVSGRKVLNARRLSENEFDAEYARAKEEYKATLPDVLCPFNNFETCSVNCASITRYESFCADRIHCQRLGKDLSGFIFWTETDEYDWIDGEWV